MNSLKVPHIEKTILKKPNIGWKTLKIFPKRMGGAPFCEQMPCRRANARDRNVNLTKETHQRFQLNNIIG